MLQVLGTLMNEIQQKAMVTSIITCAIWIHCLALNVLIKMPNGHGDLIFFFVFLFLTVEAWGAVSVCVGGWSQVYIQSEKNSQHFARNLAKTKMPARCLKQGNAFKQVASVVASSNMEAGRRRYVLELKRFYKSCSYVKVKFGSLNFIERLTPLNCMDTSLALTVNLLLIRH